ncbi:hypothetical protein C0995_012033 [Termitomyces sp. Mi166|nr:hypothetical protein C0995_012033 [Termitomyces sp. Mi166\
MSDEVDECSLIPAPENLLGLRIGAIFIILVGSSSGALFPVLARRSSWLHVPKALFDFAKYFGSGVIVAFIHLLSPALDELGSPCLGDGWTIYPYALALCMLSIFSIFVVELVAFRWGTSKLKKLGFGYDPHGHEPGSHAAHGPESSSSNERGDPESQDLKHQHGTHTNTMEDRAVAQIIGVGILEFGVLLHSILIGLTLAVDEQFKILFVVIVFHQTFEGLGIGSRLAQMRLPPQYNWVPLAGAVLYGITTPIGIAAGLGVRTTYNPNSTKALIVSGVLDALSSGILIYTGLVELLAHEFLFNKEMMEASNRKLAYAIGSMVAGWALMSLLGRWA